jgi:putative GTP pyrophosphokinase
VVNWIAPGFSSSRVKTAGKRIRDNAYGVDDIKIELEDLVVLENWRASHAYVLNTFQTNLRRRASNATITVAQRLKRRATIFDKLRREPTMQLNTMHDIAGCRLIFQTQEDFSAFRKSLQRARFEHKLKYDGEDRYNYILKPKRNGYRGIHDVCEYFVTSSYGGQWNGLLVEIQYRTIYQHAWATAVEAADLVTSSRIKFSLAKQRYERFFQLCSEVIARAHEGQRSCLGELADNEVLEELEILENSTGLLSTLRNLKRSSGLGTFKPNTILIFRTGDGSKGQPLDMEVYDNVNKAIERYSILEKQFSGQADIVLY